jgi:hypothetical protein
MDTKGETVRRVRRAARSKHPVGCRGGRRAEPM